MQLANDFQSVKVCEEGDYQIAFPTSPYDYEIGGIPTLHIAQELMSYFVKLGVSCAIYHKGRCKMGDVDLYFYPSEIRVHRIPGEAYTKWPVAVHCNSSTRDAHLTLQLSPEMIVALYEGLGACCGEEAKPHAK